VIFEPQRYAEWLRDRCQDRATPLSETAWLLACGLLDARIDTLLIPILVSSPPADLQAWLESQDWGLPANFWPARLISASFASSVSVRKALGS